MNTIELDLGATIIRAEEMLCGLSDENIKLHDFAGAIALIVSTMASEYDIDSMALIQEIESMMVQIEEVGK